DGWTHQALSDALQFATGVLTFPWTLAPIQSE
ncbi:MAG: hypothetical protein ACI9OJ_005474, partial [Myxococcota bacterium]